MGIDHVRKVKVGGWGRGAASTTSRQTRRGRVIETSAARRGATLLSLVLQKGAGGVGSRLHSLHYTLVLPFSQTMTSWASGDLIRKPRREIEHLSGFCGANH